MVEDKTMATFHLHNRLGGESSSSTTMTRLENYAIDRKNQLENIALRLGKIVTHLSLITDEEVKEDDILED